MKVFEAVQMLFSTRIAARWGINSTCKTGWQTSLDIDLTPSRSQIDLNKPIGQLPLKLVQLSWRRDTFKMSWRLIHAYLSWPMFPEAIVCNGLYLLLASLPRIKLSPVESWCISEVRYLLCKNTLLVACFFFPEEFRCFMCSASLAWLSCHERWLTWIL